MVNEHRGRSQASTFTCGSPEITVLGTRLGLSVWRVKLISVQVALGQLRLSDSSSTKLETGSTRDRSST